MLVYYNTNFIPKQDYRITSVLKQNCGYDSKTMVEHAMQPWKPLTQKKKSIFLIKGEDGKEFYIDGEVLLIAFSHHSINLTNARISGNELKFYS